MNRTLKNLNARAKTLLFLLRPHLLFGCLAGFFEFSANTLRLTKWVARQDKKNGLNDFPSWKRDYNRRFKLYRYLIDTYDLNSEALTFLEFGVSEGHSFRWWLSALTNPGSGFHGFDTFEGLPENWGKVYSKGDMAAPLPELDDSRAEFIKGLFQDSLAGFVGSNKRLLDRKLVIHMDADLFSSTIYVLGLIAPFLKKGDIIIFDEFCVPNHEFMAYRIFDRAYRIRTRLVAAVNNYLQVAFIVD